ncbi:GTPase-activating protein [Scheffersomyces spartinae]|uniref:GTPase-activating protein n=1 Tax=Scheffersomyces spartinae TaxID=45513 RepID=A0A9P7V4X9_9ASCO|nr:GTPase-activating protein [Scheffersomyces spartinae]KAG7191315.1 GTPase-activating protein [Scheffersomyces spartinae]
MSKKKQEMSQVYLGTSNEFVFGELGGKGKHLSSFLKNLSLTSTSRKSKNLGEDVNSSIYGNMQYGRVLGEELGNGSGGVGGGGSDELLSSPGSPKLRPKLVGRSISMGTSFAFSGSHGDDSTSINLGGGSSGSSQSGVGNNGGPYKHSNLSSSSHLKSHRTHSNTFYKDLDADWDADLNDVRNKKLTSVKQKDNNNNDPSNKSRNSLSLVDSFHPEIGMVSSLPSLPKRKDEKISSASKKQSLDHEDHRAQLEVAKQNQLNSKYSKFYKILKPGNTIDINELRKLSWNGIPQDLRALIWQLLLGYLPTNKLRQSSTLTRKRQEYNEGLRVLTIDFDDVKTTSNTSSSSLINNKDRQIYHQINIDVKRTNPSIKLYGDPQVQKSLRKILYLWAIRHPASGYVQGINDLVTPFFHIFLHNYIWQVQKKAEAMNNPLKESDYEGLFIPGILDENDEIEAQFLKDPQLIHTTLNSLDTSKISPRAWSVIEADTYWSLTRLLETITDNYIHEQPGILRLVGELRDLISKIDLELSKHFEHEGIEYIQFAFRWMNCLLMRELSLDLVVRMWDTYLSETPLGFSHFHIYVCAAFLIKFSGDLKERDFQEILLFLQKPPTASWKEKDIEMMLSEAFIWQSLYKDASAHLRS